MGDSWDDDDFEVSVPVVDEARGQWDDEEDEVTEKVDKTSLSEAAAPKKKKSLKEKLKEREEREREAAEARAVEVDPAVEKARRQRLVEESDYDNARDMLGGVEAPEFEGSIETFAPENAHDFEMLALHLGKHLIKHEGEFHFLTFIKSMNRELTANMRADDLKEVISYLETKRNEKLKSEKGGGKKKKTTAKKAQVGVEANDYGAFGDYERESYDDYDDFM